MHASINIGTHIFHTEDTENTGRTFIKCKGMWFSVSSVLSVVFRKTWPEYVTLFMKLST